MTHETRAANAATNETGHKREQSNFAILHENQHAVKVVPLHAFSIGSVCRVGNHNTPAGNCISPRTVSRESVMQLQVVPAASSDEQKSPGLFIHKMCGIGKAVDRHRYAGRDMPRCHQQPITH